MLNDLGQQLERVSAIYAERFDLNRDEDWFMLKLQEEFGELAAVFVELTGRSRPRGKTPEELKQHFAEELADVVSHVILLSRHFEIDLDKAVADKWLSRL